MDSCKQTLASQVAYSILFVVRHHIANRMSLLGPFVKMSRALKERGLKGAITQLYVVSLDAAVLIGMLAESSCLIALFSIHLDRRSEVRRIEGNR